MKINIKRTKDTHTIGPYEATSKEREGFKAYGRTKKAARCLLEEIVK